MMAFFVAARESAFGTKRTFFDVRLMSAFEGKADIPWKPNFWGRQE
jgi:hypothetical protein